MRNAALAFLVLSFSGSSFLASADDAAQRTLSQMPRYDRFTRVQRDLFNSVDRGITSAQWADDGQSFTYIQGGKAYRFSLKTLTAAEDSGGAPPVRGRRGGRQRSAPDRGRQYDTAFTEDGKSKAVSRDRNVFVSDADGKDEIQVTTDGSVEKRIKNGTGSWVYGEELEAREAMWFSPDGKKLAFYRFDESEVKDYFIAYDQLTVQDTLNTEPYPKAGAPNPKVDLYIYDLASKKTVKVDATFGDPALGYYLYGVRWSPDGSELFYYRQPRKQNVLDWCAANRDTGASRVVLHEERNDGWVAASGLFEHTTGNITWFKDNKRFLWISDRTGFDNIYLYDVSGKLLQTVTSHDYNVEDVKVLDEKNGLIYYTARSGNNPYLMQLHVVKIDGSGDRRLTDPALSHTVFVAPTGGSFVDYSEAVDTPPVTSVRDKNGKELKELSKADLTKFNALGLKRAERFTFTAADGKTTCYGTLTFPSDFDPKKKYPLVVSVYGGPGSGGGAERFTIPSATTELGFVMATMDGRGTDGRGRAFLCAVYRSLGGAEIDDHAAAVKELVSKRPYLDKNRVGIEGTSYGGYFSAISILRYPDVYAAACASSPVTDWRLYDSIYTERYMGQPTDDDNAKGYTAGSCMTYVKNLAGRLMLYYGTADNNVHPANSIQLADALEKVGKRYDMMVGADRGHSGMNFARQWEYFINYLILDVPKDALSQQYDKRRIGKKLTDARIAAKSSHVG